MSKKAPQYFVDSKGKRTAVLLPLKEYETLMEDLHDLMIFAERKDEPDIPIDEVIRKLRADGLL
jgi:PHD/YefM family antitoxin component YafN of YafNO toxin-antitoxin module